MKIELIQAGLEIRQRFLDRAEKLTEDAAVARAFKNIPELSPGEQNALESYASDAEASAAAAVANAAKIQAQLEA